MATPNRTLATIEDEQLQDGVRATRAIIDLDAIEANISIIRSCLTKETQIIAVIKANAYGHGAVFVARSALHAGASMLAVATVSEGIVLRRNAINAPVLVLGPVEARELRRAVENGLTLAVGDLGMADELNAIASESGRTAHVHLKLDTGMHRYGCDPDQAAALAAHISACPHLWLEGVFTHFAEADAIDDASALEQLARYDRAVDEIQSSGIAIQIRHVANSAATLRSRRFDYDAIRLGIAMYGLPPSSDVPLLPGMRPALTLKSRVARVFDLKVGDRVSYGGTYVAHRNERAALIPCGYADGYRRALSNQGWLGWSDVRLPVRGRVCMDQFVVGVPDNADVVIRDDVTLIGLGDDGDQAPTAISLAELLDTIPYEIVAGIAHRVPRLYLQRGELIGIEDLTGCRSL